MKEKIQNYRKKFDEQLEEIQDEKALQEVRNSYLGRSRGHLTYLFETLKALKAEEKPEAGKLINDFKAYVQLKIKTLQKAAQAPDAVVDRIDLTLPGEERYIGAPNPLLIIQQEIEDIFLGMGFSVEEGPEIETDYYNFEALNFPPHHPARDDWDTLYITDDWLLRTHTSPVQIRVMEKRKPPIRVITPGKVYRKETPDPTHLPMFFQVEGLVVDRGITLAHLKGTMEHFLKTLFHDKIKIRFRPSFFPFTEPSAEVDIGCPACDGNGKDCRTCGGTGWIELSGAGMIDPQVLKNVNIDPEKYSGFAWGMGIERLAMYAYQIPDLRYFYENDLRFIRQFLRK
ncbi:MAG: phenylalanine--tRNA ligase subunit alpha [Candidatus Aminicenantes bacterium]|nr:phenylalanine--tRNA ligase subunit alpha [Candidatus Aminicenantes bacterium]